MENLKEKINKYINNKGLLKTPVHYVKELLIGIIDKIDDTVDKVEDVVGGSIEQINETLKETINTTIEQNIIPYVRNKIVFDTEELNIDTKNGYYYNDNILENLKITKQDDTICPKVEFNGYCIKLQLPKGVVLQNKFINYDGFAKYIINFDNNNCKIDRYAWDLSGYLIATYLEGMTKLSYNDSLVFESLNRGRLQMTTGPVSENELLISEVGTTIGDEAFKYCYGLTSVVIPNSVTSIGWGAFYDCTRLTSIEIPNSVNNIGNYAFNGCSKLTSVVIPDSVTSIGAGTFLGCSKLTSVVIGNQVTSIGMYAFKDCSSLTSITIPDSVTSIENSAFPGCTRLTSITIPKSVTRILSGAFSNTGLTTIIVDENNPIFDSRENCNAIIETETNTLRFGCENTIIPDSVTSIGDSAFSGCSGLTSVVIPNSVTSIGGSAFSGCSGLTSVEIGNSVTSIGGSAFYNCWELTQVVITSIVPPSLGYRAFFGVNSNLIIYVPDESVDAYKKATNWNSYSSKIKPLSEKPV